jgi:hypothetical protein
MDKHSAEYRRGLTRSCEDACEYIDNVIRKYVEILGGQNFKRGVSLQELIDYKAEKRNRTEEDKFKLYISVVDNIVSDLAGYFGVDLTGIDLSWTTNRIADVILKYINNRPIIILRQIEGDSNV